MNKFSQTLEKKYTLLIGLIAYILILTAVCWYKYFVFGYNALDLAIYNNVFFNAINNNGWWSSIQGHHYFADHFEPWLYFFLPLYWLWPSPLNLLLWQSTILACISIPIYLIAKHIFNQKLAIAVALVWLINPLAWNINLHEWHLLPLAIPLLLGAYYFYLQNQFKYYLIFLALALLVREDVAIAVGGFFLLGLIEKKSLRWWLTPLLLSTTYFLLSNIIIGYFQAGGSRFSVYYEWLLSAKVTDLIWHIYSFGNVEMILGLLIAFLFLPLLASRYLFLAVGVFLQFVLGEPGGSNIIIDTHYSSLFLPALIISSLWGLKNIQSKNSTLSKWLYFDTSLTKLITGVCLVYLLLFLGPGWGIIKNIYQPSNDHWPNRLLHDIPPGATVAAGYKYLPKLAGREKLYSLHYIFTGHQQFSSEVYKYEQPDFIVMDPDDMIYYALQFPKSKSYHQYYPEGYDNLKKLLANYELKYFHPQLLFWQKNQTPTTLEYVATFSPINREPQELDKFILTSEIKNDLLAISWQINSTTSDDYFLLANYEDNSSYLRPLLYFTPTQVWQTENFYQTYLPLLPGQNSSLQIVTLQGHIEINNWRGTKANITIQPQSDLINLP